MKKSNLYLSILSALIISACGSSSSNDNQSVDPTPNTTPTHNQNQNTNTNPKPTKPQSPAANPNPESNHQAQAQSNQTQNNQPINSKKAPAIKAKPTTTHKKNKTNPQPNSSQVKAPDPIDIDTLTKTEADDLVKNATQKAQDAEIAKSAAASEKSIADSARNQALTDLQAAANKVKGASKADLPLAQKELENAKKLYEEQAAKAAEAAKKLAEETDKAAMAKQEENLAKNAQKYVAEKSVDPEAVIDATAAKQKQLQTAAETQALQDKQDTLNEEAQVIADKKAALESIKNEYEGIAATATEDDAKKAAKDEVEKLKKEIAELTKEEKAKRDEADKLNVPIQQATVVSQDAATKAGVAENDAKYRGVYASTGAYDESTSYKNLKKVKFDPSSNELELFLKDSDEPIKFKYADLTTSIVSGSNTYGKFNVVDGKSIVAKEVTSIAGETKSIYGVIDNNFFSVGEVAPNSKIEDYIKNDITMTYGNFTSARGGALLKTEKGTNLVADVKATATFKDKKLEGSFKNFREYSTIGTVSTSPYTQEGFTAATEIGFEAKIDGIKFVPVDAPKPNDAKVYGYFYREFARDIGGLVEHDKFNGSFGANN